MCVSHERVQLGITIYILCVCVSVLHIIEQLGNNIYCVCVSFRVQLGTNMPAKAQLNSSTVRVCVFVWVCMCAHE